MKGDTAKSFHQIKCHLKGKVKHESMVDKDETDTSTVTWASYYRIDWSAERAHVK